MDERTQELAQAWLKKAVSDLRTARLGFETPDGPLDTAIYHCQQTAEKSVKAFLTLHSLAFDKTHDIAKLVSQAAAVEPCFSELEDAAEELTPYAVLYRYPGEQGFIEPSRDELESALKTAERFVEFVRKRLPA